MSIDYLFEVERAVDAGKELFACAGAGRNQWVIAKTIDDLRKVAKRTADSQKMAIVIYRLISKSEAVAGDPFLVPVEIGDPGARGEPQVKWKVVDTKDAAEMFKDVRKGPPPFFGMQSEETINPGA
jgi:hypothetical protein